MNRIIVVDDDEEVLDTIQLVLELGGFEVLALNDGEEINDAIQNFSPQLVILDIVLGKLDGRSINNEIKGNPKSKHIPVLMMSGLYESSDIQSLETPPDDFVAKPFKMEILLEKIETLINRNTKRYHVN